MEQKCERESYIYKRGNFKIKAQRQFSGVRIIFNINC